MCDISAVAVDSCAHGQTAGGHPSGTTPGPILSGGMLSQLPLLGSDGAGGVLAALVQPASRRAWSNCAVGLTTISRPAMSQRSWMRCSTWSRLTPPGPRRNSRTHGHPLERWREVVQSRNRRFSPRSWPKTPPSTHLCSSAPSRGRDLVALYLTGAMHVIANPTFRYVRSHRRQQRGSPEFETMIDDVHVNGVDIITWDEHGADHRLQSDAAPVASTDHRPGTYGPHCCSRCREVLTLVSARAW